MLCRTEAFEAFASVSSVLSGADTGVVAVDIVGRYWDTYNLPHADVVVSVDERDDRAVDHATRALSAAFATSPVARRSDRHGSSAVARLRVDVPVGARTARVFVVVVPAWSRFPVVLEATASAALAAELRQCAEDLGLVYDDGLFRLSRVYGTMTPVTVRFEGVGGVFEYLMVPDDLVDRHMQSRVV